MLYSILDMILDIELLPDFDTLNMRFDFNIKSEQQQQQQQQLLLQ